MELETANKNLESRLKVSQRVRVCQIRKNNVKWLAVHIFKFYFRLLRGASLYWNPKLKNLTNPLALQENPAHLGTSANYFTQKLTN